jgi:hypothetical protein
VIWAYPPLSATGCSVMCTFIPMGTVVLAASHRHMDETPTIYSMAVIYELPGVQSCAESKTA